MLHTYTTLFDRFPAKNNVELLVACVQPTKLQLMVQSDSMVIVKNQVGTIDRFMTVIVGCWYTVFDIFKSRGCIRSTTNSICARLFFWLQILVDNSQEFEISMAVKDAEGRTLENVDSLSFDVGVSDDSLAQVKATEFENPKTPFAGGQVAEKGAFL